MRRTTISLTKGEVFAVLDALDSEASRLEQRPPPEAGARAHCIICSNVLARMLDTIPREWADEWEET